MKTRIESKDLLTFKNAFSIKAQNGEDGLDMSFLIFINLKWLIFF